MVVLTRSTGNGGDPDRAGEGPTAAIVTCRDYGRFLRQCLDSLLAQTVPFARIVVVDDASEDETPAICAEYVGRITYLRTEWRDACAARRTGYAALVERMRFLLFVDADNWLESDYHARLRAAMKDRRVGVAYGEMHRFNDATGEPGKVLAREFDYAALRQDNYIDTCSLVRVEAYEQVGGWELVGGFQDWLLWLRITRAGWLGRLVHGAVFHYRVHPASMISNRWESKMHDTGRLEVVKRGHFVSIVTLFSGRWWMLERYERFLGTIQWRRENLHVVAVNNCEVPEFGQRLRAMLTRTGLTHTVVNVPEQAVKASAAADTADSRAHRTEHAYAINAHLAKLYAVARTYLPAGTDYVWSLEDDIEPPADALDNLVLGFLKSPQVAGVVCGVAMSRFGATPHLLTWHGTPKEQDTARVMQTQHVPEHGRYARINGGGFYCTLFRRDVFNSFAFRPSPWWQHNRRTWYDWAASCDVAAFGWHWLLSGSVRCKHWQADGTALEVPETLPV